MVEPIHVRIVPGASEVETAFAVVLHEAWRRKRGGTVVVETGDERLRDGLAWLGVPGDARGPGGTPPLRLPALTRLPATDLAWYREGGFLPEALVNYLAWLGFRTDREAFDLDEFARDFEPEAMRGEAPPFRLAHLERLNRTHLRALDRETLVARLRDASPLAASEDPALVESVAPLARDRLTRLTDFDRLAGFFFRQDVRPPHDELIPRRKTDTNAAAVLRLAREAIAHLDPLESKALGERFRELANQSDWTAGELFHALRWALAGRREAPPLLESICVLGKATCIERIDAAIDVLGSPENPILGPARPEA